MSKYIIEIEEKPLCVFDKDTQTYFPRLWRVKGFNSLVLDKEGLSRLEELNSDYINEHFGELQDTAYQKGFEDGKKEAESSEVIEQAKMDAFNKGMLHKGEKIYDAYQRGLRKGNDIGYKDGFEDGKAVNDKGCEGCKWAGDPHTYSPCERCCNCYKNEWTAKADKIGVGDVVKTYNGITFVVTKATIDGIVVGFNGEGNTCRFALSEVTKTGEHYNINEILGGLCDD